jgi:hypothetical protein
VGSPPARTVGSGHFRQQDVDYNLEDDHVHWRQDWNVHSFLRALEEVYALEPKDRFMESTSIWQSITYELRGILHVALGYDDTLCSLSVLRTDSLTSHVDFGVEN